MAVCRYCHQPIIWKRIKSGWKPVDPNGTSHYQSCEYYSMGGQKANSQARVNQLLREIHAIDKKQKIVPK